jgi:predicted helicase
VGRNPARRARSSPKHILQHLYGFEYLLAPYTIAHLKLSQYLNDKGHPLKGNERLQVFLINTLEPVMVEPDQAKLWPVPALATEIREADAVKKKQILVITGNPPYSGHSKNEGFKAEIGGYKYTTEKDAQGREVEKPLGERNPKWLNDDYVKLSASRS